METRTNPLTRWGRALAVVLFLATGMTGDLGGMLAGSSKREPVSDRIEEVVTGPRKG